MMRLGRRASLIVALLLLTSAATACAECAWVLWQETRPDMLAPGGDKDPVMFIRGNPVWEIQEVRPTQEACDALKEQLWKYVRRKEGPIMKGNKPVGEWSVNLLCLPDTVDPRGPKGGAR
jgi:hypothetical protein